MKKEYFARFLVLLFIMIAVAIPIAGKLIFAKDRENAIKLNARTFENGGWGINNIKATVGKPIHLQLTSEDVMHGFAIGDYNLTPVDVFPGEFVNVTLNFDKPGIYTFFCTHWCSPSHTRMRGTIEVSSAVDPMQVNTIP